MARRGLSRQKAALCPGKPREPLRLTGRPPLKARGLPGAHQPWGPGGGGGGGREARLAREDGHPPATRGSRAPRDQGSLSPWGLEGARCREERPRASMGATWAEAELPSCRASVGPVCGAQSRGRPWLPAGQTTHGCPLSLRAEEAKREARQVPPAACRLVVGTAFSCSVRPTGLVSRPQPHATRRTFDEAAHLSQLPSRPQRLQGLQEQARVLAWGDKEGLWRGCVWRGAWPCGLSLGLACSPGRGASHSARWGASSSAQGARTRVPTAVGPWSV